MDKKKANILHIVTNLSDGGLEKVVYLIIKHLNRTEFNHIVAVLTKNENDFLVSKFKELGVQVETFNFDNRVFSYKSIFKNIPQLAELLKLIRKKKISVIHSHDVFPAFVARVSYVLSILSFYRPRKVIITLHNIYFWLKPIHHFINRILSIFTYRIVCVSNAVRDYSLKHDKIKTSKYQVIYNGVESGSYAPDQNCVSEYYSEFGYSGNEFIIGNVGVLSVRKGQKYIIEAFHKFIKKYPEARLLIMGSERSHEKDTANEIHDLIKKYELSDTVRIVPSRVDINKIYNIFNVYVMASISEGQSLSAIEAMLNSRICLFSDIEPFKEMITDGENGFLFSSENSDDLFAKLEFIRNDFTNLQYVGKKTRETALLRYDVLNMSNSYGLLYKI